MIIYVLPSKLLSYIDIALLAIFLLHFVFAICIYLYQSFNSQMFTGKYQLHVGKIKSELALPHLDIYRFHAFIQNLHDIFSSVKE